MSDLFIISPVFVCAFFFVMGRLNPRSYYRESRQYFCDVAMLAGVAGLILMATYYVWPKIPAVDLLGITFDGSSLFWQVIALYLIYSFGNYWIHRPKHQYLWRIHELHHAPAHLDSTLTYFRHPVEMLFNIAYMIVVGKLMTDTAWTVMLMALCIEGILESFHHANIRLPKWTMPIGYIIQTPQMHIAHHKRGVHSNNYSPLSLWDTIFFTLSIDIPQKWNYCEVGLSKYDLRYKRNESSSPEATGSHHGHPDVSKRNPSSAASAGSYSADLSARDGNKNTLV